MEVVCQGYRLFIEPVRLILHASNISFTETLAGGDQKHVYIINEDKLMISSYKEVINYACTRCFKSEQWRNDNPEEYCFDAIPFSDKNLPKLEQYYLKLADAILAGNPVPSDPTEFLSEYVEILKEKRFLAGNAWTPCDLFLYEIIKTLDAVHQKPKIHELYKFCERLETLVHLRRYLVSSDSYYRPFTEKVPSVFMKRNEVFQKKLPALCHFVMSEGVLMASQKKLADSDELVEFCDHVPFSCFPKKISKQELTSLLEIQKRWNVLLNAMGRDFDWITTHLKDMIEREDFVRRLYNISKKCKSYPHTQKKFFAILRNDFMYQSLQNRWLQVEYNVIAITFMPFSDKIQRIHKQIAENYFEEQADYHLSENFALLEEGLLAAYNAYGNPKAIVLIIVLPKFETNIFEQRAIEKRLFDHGIHCIRASFEDVWKNHKFDESTGTLTVFGQEVGLVYMRAGYQPDHYVSEEDWKAREVIEMSRALKCPTVDYQLINFKIFQVYLARDEVLARFVPKMEEREQIQENFAKFWELEDAKEIPKILALVEEDPSLYVLKPQREGGANNYFGQDIIDKFKTLSHEDLSTYILMEKIDSSPHIGFMVKNKNMVVSPCTSEFGVYGYILSDPEGMVKSNVGGTLVRTKPTSHSEGGITAGFGVLDSFIYE